MKLKPSYETETYLTQGGHYGIRQVGWDGEEHCILLTPEQMRLLMVDFEEALADCSWFNEAE